MMFWQEKVENGLTFSTFTLFIIGQYSKDEHKKGVTLEDI